MTNGGIANLSQTQRFVLRWMSSDQTAIKIAGYGNAAYLSAARALVRKGLAYTHRTGYYGLTDTGRSVAKIVVEEHSKTQCVSSRARSKVRRVSPPSSSSAAVLQAKEEA